MDVDSLRSTLNAHGQAHLLRFWDRLSSDEQKQLYDDLSSIDYATINKNYQQCAESLKRAEAGEKVDDQIQPLPAETFGSVTKTPPELLQKYKHEGYQQIANSRVAVLLLAGGQGTRLGVNYPKGMYDVGLPSRKTLYQLQAERILKVQELAREATGTPGTVPWYAHRSILCAVE